MIRIFTNVWCIVGLTSPKADFKVQHNTVTLESEDSFDFAATGTVGPIAECAATGLGITTCILLSHRKNHIFSLFFIINMGV